MSSNAPAHGARITLAALATAAGLLANPAAQSAQLAGTGIGSVKADGGNRPASAPGAASAPKAAASRPAGREAR